MEERWVMKAPLEPGTSRWSSAEAEIGWFLARKHSLFRSESRES